MVIVICVYWFTPGVIVSRAVEMGVKGVSYPGPRSVGGPPYPVRANARGPVSERRSWA